MGAGSVRAWEDRGIMGSAVPYRLTMSDEGSSVRFAVMDAADRVAGAVRVHVCGRGRATGWDVVYFAVRPGAPRRRLTAALCHGLVQALRANRVRTLVATL